MKLYATGDTHGNFGRFRPEYFPESRELTKEDVVLQLGDFGGVWFGDERDDETLDWLEGLPFTVAFVSGNHENYNALARYPVETWHGGKVQPIRPHVLHLMRGQVFELAGFTFFTMGGAASHDIEDGILSLDDPNFERKYIKNIQIEVWLHKEEGGGKACFILPASSYHLICSLTCIPFQQLRDCWGHGAVYFRSFRESGAEGF